jgi:hypothetical protein
LEKYISQPVATNMAYIANDGKYPVAVSFCMMFSYSNVTTDTNLEKEVIEGLLSVEAQFLGEQIWQNIYNRSKLSSESILPMRKFTSFSWSEETFKLCMSFQLGTETQKLNELRFRYKWGDCYHFKIFTPPNLRAFVHGWGSFEANRYEIPIVERSQIFQLNQETMATTSTDTRKCYNYENSLLDECLEKQAVVYAHSIVGCVSELQRSCIVACKCSQIGLGQGF